MSPKDPLYTLEMNEEQARALVAACDLYSRLMMGQVMELLRHIRFQRVLPSVVPFPQERPVDDDAVEQILKMLSVEVTGSSGSGSWGIGSNKIPNVARVAYDIQQVIRNTLAWKRKPEGDWTVDFDKPMCWSGLPLPKCKPAEGTTITLPKGMTIEEAVSAIKERHEKLQDGFYKGKDPIVSVSVVEEE